MILFKQTVPATLENVRWLRKNLGRKLEDSCLRAIDPKLYDRRLTLSLIDSILLAVTEIANNVVQHASPKPSFMALEVRLVGAALRLEFTNDGGAFTGGLGTSGWMFGGKDKMVFTADDLTLTHSQ